jgi:hypothetical protein
MSKFFISFLLIILTASFAFGQESQNTAKLNLMAADKSSNPIGDLGKDEISLLIDGKPQAIISLEKQEEFYQKSRRQKRRRGDFSGKFTGSRRPDNFAFADAIRRRLRGFGGREKQIFRN